MVTKEGFNASRIRKEELTKIENATLEDAKIDLEYQVDLSKLPKRHRGEALNHQEDASKFGPSCAAVYLKGHTATWGGYKKDASSYLARNKDPDCKLADFLTKSQELFENSGLSDDEPISCLYPGTTSRSCLVRWAEHDSHSSTSLNSLFFRQFEKTIQFPVMCVLSGNIDMSLVCESFVASLLQLSTLATLRKSDPNASFLFQADDGSALTRTGAGVNLHHRQDVLSFVTHFHGPRDTPLSKISLPKSVTLCLQNKEGRILDYCGGDYFVKKYGEVISTLDDLTVEHLHSYVSSFGRSRAVANIAKQKGISLEEASSELSSRGHTGAIANIAEEENMSLEEASSEWSSRGRTRAIANFAKKENMSLEEASSEMSRKGYDNGIGLVSKEQLKKWSRGAGRSSAGMDIDAIDSLADLVRGASKTAVNFDAKVRAISAVPGIKHPSIRWYFCNRGNATFKKNLSGDWVGEPGTGLCVKVIPESSSHIIRQSLTATMDVLREDPDFLMKPWNDILNALVNILGGDPPVYGISQKNILVPGTTITLNQNENDTIEMFREYAKKHRVGKEKIDLPKRRSKDEHLYLFVNRKSKPGKKEATKTKNKYLLDTIKEFGFDLGSFEPDK